MKLLDKTQSFPARAKIAAEESLSAVAYCLKMSRMTIARARWSGGMSGPRPGFQDDKRDTGGDLFAPLWQPGSCNRGPKGCLIGLPDEPG